MCDNMKDSIVETWLETKLFNAFQTAGISITTPARKFFVAALVAQLEEGIVRDASHLFALLNNMPCSDLPTFYTVKYGKRPISFNRAVRLLADLHDQWIGLRNS